MRRPSGWYSLHAGVRIAAQDRPALERLVRYILRPPLSHNRLSLREDGMLVLRLKTAWRNGTTALLLSGSELLQRLAAIVPRPRSQARRWTVPMATWRAVREHAVKEGESASGRGGTGSGSNHCFLDIPGIMSV